ncbi:hypothetical protein Pla144_09730 [Bythopirellula polymerisocia]|uniref:Uncharacterized protein n=1 Tax=Bythopirellula polymerisocia TaxID=2528003 RepID=A0A5C6D3E8_9BACT|nr:hypothetical protein Pla144_09730 [Bythopirellula polymerisocia]
MRGRETPSLPEQTVLTMPKQEAADTVKHVKSRPCAAAHELRRKLFNGSTHERGSRI